MSATFTRKSLISWGAYDYAQHVFEHLRLRTTELRY